ncbi:hypothetical protein F6R98_19700 [Candidatus Methylospira mobilis]|uniref:Uncharacterized protein n=1 Tax=Candidatus Methylospira mobilis TaxID=1808979 RepID=A0A5Q0BR73_9GAMM|nr:hypothetical protein [Candidatus Methylospira mobilis]QFY44578.1 hypothetical protein F6R98_19700 [Candidatus Methylospira mobilis]
MKTLSLLILSVIVVLTITMQSERHNFSPFEAASAADLEQNFSDAQEILATLLSPNLQAMDPLPSQAELDRLTGQRLDDFKRIAAVFKKHPEESVPFLASKLTPNLPDAGDSGICALQLLFEINTPPSWKVIQGAQAHADEIVSRVAEQMTKDKQDVLWGFHADK